MQRTVLDLNTDSKRKVLIIGESYMNLEMETDSLLKNGNITHGGKYGFHPYGMTAAAAVTVGKMGGKCVLCSKLAKDSNGNRLKEYYEKNGLDTGMITFPEGAQTGFAVTLYGKNSETEHYVSKGANGRFTKKDIDEAFGTCPDVFLVPQEELVCAETDEDKPALQTQKSDEPVDENASSDEPAQEKEKGEEESHSAVTDPRGRDTLALYACNAAMERGVDMIVDYNSAASALPLSDFKGIKAFIISDETLSKMTGFYLTSEDRIVRALISLKSKIPSKYYIIQVGNNTSLVYDGNSYQKIMLPAPDGVSEGKMNPTYVGAFIAEYLETKNIIRACTCAGVTSLLTKAHDGVLEKVPSKREVEEYISQKGINTRVW